MNTLREAAQAVLDRWDSPRWTWHLGPTADLMATLRAALAEPDYWQEEARRYAGNADYWRKRYEALAEPVQEFATTNIGCLGMPVNTPVTPPQTAEPVQEPVAWVLALPDGRLDRLSVVAYDDEAEEMLQRSIAGCTLVPLYTAPPQRKPFDEHFEVNFCARCGKRTRDVHSCTPPPKL